MHISYGYAWNGIPFLQEWNGHSIWNGMVHSIPVGMEWMLFIPAGMEWTISFLQEWKAFFHSWRDGINRFYEQSLFVLNHVGGGGNLVHCYCMKTPSGLKVMQG